MFMRIFILLFCSTVFGFTPIDLFPQDAEIVVDRDQRVTFDEVFEMIKHQTEYNFIYREDLFKNAPKVPLKKGKIKTNRLLEIILADRLYQVSFNDENTIMVSELLPVNTLFQNILSGTVSDESGIPLAGVNVIVNDNERGTATDFDGNYQIRVGTGDKVSFSYIGFVTQNFIIENQTSLDVQMAEDTAKLSEVVVVGYGSQERDKIGSSIEQFEAKEIEKRAPGVPNVANILGGQIKGLNITQSSGAPGAQSNINIRGLTSPFGNSPESTLICY